MRLLVDANSQFGLNELQSVNFIYKVLISVRCRKCFTTESRMKGRGAQQILSACCPWLLVVWLCPRNLAAIHGHVQPISSD